MGRAMMIILLAFGVQEMMAKPPQQNGGNDGPQWLKNILTQGGATPEIDQRRAGQVVQRGMREIKEKPKQPSIFDKLADKWFNKGPQPPRAFPQQALPLTVPQQAFPVRGSISQPFQPPTALQRPTAFRGPILDAEMKDPEDNSSSIFVVGFIAFFAGAGITYAVAGPPSRARSYF